MPNTPIPPPLPADFALDLGAAYRRAEAATEGPWIQHPLNRVAIYQPKFLCWIPQEPDDAAFIAAARTDVPAAIRLAAHYKADSAYIRDEFDRYAKQAEAGFMAVTSDLTAAKARLAAAEQECERLRDERDAARAYIEGEGGHPAGCAYWHGGDPECGPEDTKIQRCNCGLSYALGLKSEPAAAAHYRQMSTEEWP